MQHMAESVDMFVPDDIAGEARALQLAAERQLDIEKHTVDETLSFSERLDLHLQHGTPVQQCFALETLPLLAQECGKLAPLLKLVHVDTLPDEHYEVLASSLTQIAAVLAQHQPTREDPNVLVPVTLAGMRRLLQRHPLCAYGWTAAVAAVARALDASLVSTQLLPAVRPSCTAAHARTRAHAASLLGALTPALPPPLASTTILPLVLHLCQDTEGCVRQAACAQLPTLGAVLGGGDVVAHVLPVVVELLQDEDSAVCCTALTTILDLVTPSPPASPTCHTPPSHPPHTTQSPPPPLPPQLVTLCTTPPHDATITACIAQHAARLYPAVLKHLTEQHPPDAAPTTTTTSTTATTTPAHVIAGYIKLAHPTRLPDATIRATCIAALEPMCAQLVTSCQQAQGQQHGQQQDLAVPLLSMLKGGHAGDPVHHVRACCAQVVPAVVAAVGTGVSVVSGVEILCRLVQDTTPTVQVAACKALMVMLTGTTTPQQASSPGTTPQQASPSAPREASTSTDHLPPCQFPQVPQFPQVSIAGKLFPLLQFPQVPQVPQVPVAVCGTIVEAVQAGHARVAQGTGGGTCSRQWRVHLALAQLAACVCKVFPGQTPIEHLIPSTVQQLKQGVPDVRQAAALGVLLLLRHSRKANTRTEVYNQLIRDLARSRCYKHRLAFVDVCRGTPLLFSTSFIKAYFWSPVLALMHDPVSNVRLYAMPLLPMLKQALQLPQDVSLLEQFNESMGAVMMDADPDVMAAAHCIADECKRASIRMAVVARDTQAALFEAEDHAREAAEVGLLPVTAKEESDTHGPHHAVPAKPRGGQAGHVDGKCGKGSKGVVVGKMHGASKGGVHTRTRCA